MAVGGVVALLGLLWGLADVCYTNFATGGEVCKASPTGNPFYDFIIIWSIIALGSVIFVAYGVAIIVQRVRGTQRQSGQDYRLKATSTARD